VLCCFIVFWRGAKKWSGLGRLEGWLNVPKDHPKRPS